MKIPKKTFIAATFVALLFVADVNATVTCSGVPNYLGVDTNGIVYIALGGSGIHQICNLVTQGSFQMNPTICKFTYSSLLANKMGEKSVNTFYNDSTLQTCAAIQPWSTQNSFYYLEQP